MIKVGIVAGAEFNMLVRTRAFVITVLLMPVLVAGSIVVQRIIAKQVDRTPRAFAVIDGTGALYDELAARTRERNAAVASGLLAGAPFAPERVDPGARSLDDLRVELSDRVRRGDIFAFVEIPADALGETGAGRIEYYSDHPTYEDLRTWVELSLNDQIRRQRLKRAGVDPEVVARLDRRLPSDHVGLLARGADGKITSTGRVDVVQTYIVPLGLMYILFLTIFMSAPQLMNAVMQEKMSRISEVLIGSVSAFELMLGKLIGSAATSLVLALVYLGGGFAVAAYSGYLHAITPSLVLYFVLFMVLAVLFYGSIFIAVGAACSDLKDAQSLLTPVMLVALMPMFAWQLVLKSPSSPAAVAISLFPPATPFLMLLRLAVQPGPPWWQVAAGVLLAAGSAMVCVWAAGRIFRVGILTQGKSAGFGQMLRWIWVR